MEQKIARSVIFDDLGVRQDVGQRLQALLFRQDGVQLSSREGVVEDAEQAVALWKVVVDQINQIIRFSDRLNYLSETENLKKVGESVGRSQ